LAPGGKIFRTTESFLSFSKQDKKGKNKKQLSAF